MFSLVGWADWLGCLTGLLAGLLAGCPFSSVTIKHNLLLVAPKMCWSQIPDTFNTFQIVWLLPIAAEQMNGEWRIACY